jgi:hypothetical protein
MPQWPSGPDLDGALDGSWSVWFVTIPDTYDDTCDLIIQRLEGAGVRGAEVIAGNVVATRYDMH